MVAVGDLAYPPNRLVNIVGVQLITNISNVSAGGMAIKIQGPCSCGVGVLSPFEADIGLVVFIVRPKSRKVYKRSQIYPCGMKRISIDVGQGSLGVY